MVSHRLPCTQHTAHSTLLCHTMFSIVNAVAIMQQLCSVWPNMAECQTNKEHSRHHPYNTNKAHNKHVCLQSRSHNAAHKFLRNKHFLKWTLAHQRSFSFYLSSLSFHRHQSTELNANRSLNNIIMNLWFGCCCLCCYIFHVQHFASIFAGNLFFKRATPNTNCILITSDGKKEHKTVANLVGKWIHL